MPVFVRFHKKDAETFKTLETLSTYMCISKFTGYAISDVYGDGSRLEAIFFGSQ